MPGCVTDHPTLWQFLDELQAQEQQRQASTAARTAQLRAERAGHQGLEPGDWTEQAAHYNARYQVESAALWGDEVVDAYTAPYTVCSVPLKSPPAALKSTSGNYRRQLPPSPATTATPSYAR